MPETTTTSNPPTTTADPSSCCCDTTTTSDPVCKCASPVTLDFHTNVIVPITLEINMPRGDSGFPEQNLFLKSYIHGCHDINAAYCYAQNNTLRTSSCLVRRVGTQPFNIHPPYFSIEEPVNCNIRPPVSIIAGGATTYTLFDSCDYLYYFSSIDYLSYIEGIYGYLPRFVDLERNGFNPAFADSNNFSLNGSNGLFTCCNRGILQDLIMHEVYWANEISKVDVDVATFSPYVRLKFPFFIDKPAEAWKRGELDNLTLYAPIVLYIHIAWAFSVSVSSIYGTLKFVYLISTCNMFVKLLQFPFSGDSVNLDYHSYRIGYIVDDYSYMSDHWLLPHGNRYKPLNLDNRTRLSILFPDILNAVENIQATLHFGEITPNPAHSEDGAIDWEYIYKSQVFSRVYPGYSSPFRNCSFDGYDLQWIDQRV